MPFPGSRVDIDDKRYLITAKEGNVHDCFEFVDNERAEGPPRRFVENPFGKRYIWLDSFMKGYRGRWMIVGEEIQISNEDVLVDFADFPLICQGPTICARGAYLRIMGHLYEVEKFRTSLVTTNLILHELRPDHPARPFLGDVPYREPASRFDREIL